MRSRYVRSAVIAAVVFAVLLAPGVISAAWAQSNAPGPILYNGFGPRLSAAEFQKLATMPTPRMADSHPDLTGYWGPPPGTAPSGDNYGSTTVSNDGKTTILGILNPHQIDQGLSAAANARPEPVPSRDGEPNPLYKPEYKARVDAVQTRDIAFTDPIYRCQPQGVPRLGAPWEIAQTPTTVFFLYGDNDRTDGGRVRIIPIDGRPHNPEADAKPMGDSIGHWEGDTLVVEVTNLSDDTWLESYRGGATLHSAKLRVVEHLTRQGNTLRYQVTIDDPVMFVKPWTKPTTTLILTPGKHTREDYPCITRGAEHHDFNADSQGFELDAATLKKLGQSQTEGSRK
jgi:hypothetical protein